MFSAERFEMKEFNQGSGEDSVLLRGRVGERCQ